MEVPLSPADGMPTSCVVNADDLQTVSKRLILNRITQLSAEKMADVARAIGFALDLPIDL